MSSCDTCFPLIKWLLLLRYSARFFGSHLEHIIVASGTVFNQVLLWKVQGKKDESNRTPVLQRLTGHEGVIFSINFNKSGTLLSSVSDDRSIRLWKVTNLTTFESNGFVEPLLVVYGHAARVWDAKLLETCFVSIGEDLVCNVWSYDGNVVKTYKGHTGIELFSMIFLFRRLACIFFFNFALYLQSRTNIGSWVR